MKKKIVIVRQQDEKDCGPCALKSIVEYYGGYVSLERIREHCYTTYEGTTVYHLVRAAQKYGFDAIAKKYLDNQLTNIKLPAIIHVRYENGLTHFMCLYEITNDNLILMDPAKGKVKMSTDDFFKIFTGVVIELSSKNEIICLKKESSIYDLFFSIIKQNKNLCINLLITNILLMIVTIISGLYFKVGYEYIQNGTYINTINYLIYLFLTIFLLKCWFSFLKIYYETHIDKNIDVSILSNFITHVFNLPSKVINIRPIGEFISRINEISNIKDTFSKLFISSFVELILSIGSIVILFCINKTLAFLLCLIMLIYIGITFLFNPYLYKRIRQNIDYQTEINSCLIENMHMINSIKNLNQIPKALEKIEDKLSILLYDDFTFSSSLNGIEFVKSFLNEICVFLVNTIGFYFIYKGDLLLIDLVIFNTLMTYFTNPIKNIVSLIPSFNFLRASFRKICDFVDLEEEKIGELESFETGDIRFNNVDFSYNDYKKIINHFNLTIKCGEKIMIKGSSGCGKSTLCQLLQRIYSPSSGTIDICGKNIADYSLATLRNNIVYVGQKESLYTDTIKNNIKAFAYSDNNFDKVCKICLIDDIVDKKMFRYDFGVDNNFANISGGEKQRIVLARALMRGGNILILDEALSELDFKSEQIIINNIKTNYPEKTLIYISHKRQDSLFDRVITMRIEND